MHRTDDSTIMINRKLFSQEFKQWRTRRVGENNGHEKGEKKGRKEK